MVLNPRSNWIPPRITDKDVPLVCHKWKFDVDDLDRNLSTSINLALIHLTVNDAWLIAIQNSPTLTNNVER